LSKAKLKDYLHILRYAHETFEIIGDEEVQESIKTVFGKYKELLELEEIPRKHSDKVKKYIDFINTFDRCNILKQGKKLNG